MTDTTNRLALPLIAAGQAQKEITHNEALSLVDMLAQPVVQSVAPAAVPVNPVLGACWIVGVGAGGVWAGYDGALACATAGGWRFASAFEGMSVWSLADQQVVNRSGGTWVIGTVNARKIQINGVQLLINRQPAIAGPSGGAVIDGEARATIASLLAMMRIHGLIAV